MSDTSGAPTAPAELPPAAPRHERWRDVMTAIAMFSIGMVATLQNTGVMAAVLLLQNIPTDRKDMVLMVVNATGTLQGMVLQYYFGSSAGSADKNAAINRLATKP
jgi:hypothetical protein